MRVRRAGWHVVRDERGWKMDELAVRNVWVADVMPALDPWAAFAVVDATTERRFCFAYEKRRRAPLGEVQSVASETGVLPPDWNDPLLAALAGASLYDAEGGDAGSVTLDGIGYRVEFGAPALSTSIQFSNPKTEGTRSLERALLAAATAIADAVDNSHVADYLTLWLPYVASD